MPFSFSENQQKIIDHKDGSLLVSAAAGAGKTAVLVERIAKMVTREEDPVDIDRILVVTFTRLAASQMRERLERAFLQRLETADENQRARIEEQMRLLPLASITTNSSFSLSIVKESISSLKDKVDPGFRNAEETELKLIKADVIKETLEACYDQALQDPESEEAIRFSSFMDTYGDQRDDAKAKKLLLEIYEFMSNDPYPIDWLNKNVESLDPSTWGKGNPFVDRIMQMLNEQITAFVNRIEAVADLYRKNLATYTETRTRADQNRKNVEEKIIQKLRAKAFKIKKEIEADQIGEAVKSCEEKLPNNILAIFTDGNEETAAKKLMTEARATVKEIDRLQYLSTDTGYQTLLTSYVAPAMYGMRDILLKFDERYKQEKRERNILEFSDFEHYALEILSDEKDPSKDSAVAEAMQERIRYIFIDEYQDSNRMQEAVINHIARKDKHGHPTNVFMVGDVKQCIYHFRQSDPSLFVEKSKRFKEDVPGKAPAKERLIRLNQNYRSNPEILNNVNYIFSSLMKPCVGDIDYTSAEALNSFKPTSEYTTKAKNGSQVKLIVLEYRSSTAAYTDEAEQAALEIKRLHDEEGLAWKDIVILLRSVSKRGLFYQNALTKHGIPFYSESTESFYNALEIRTMLNLLRVIDNPRQDVALFGVLNSDLVKLTDDELGMIRLTFPKAECFFDAISMFASASFYENSVESGIQRRLDRFLKDLEHWRKRSSVVTIHDLLWELYFTTGLYLYFSAMPRGEIRKANLDLLLKKTVDFEDGTFSGLYQFLRYVTELDREKTIEQEASIASENMDAVRIMTVHKSKGLEFKAVILGTIEYGFSLSKKLSGDILCDQKEGIGPKILDKVNMRQYDSVPNDIVKHRMRIDNLAEEMRLLYVAMTRAEEILIMIGSTRKNFDHVSATKDSSYEMSMEQIMSSDSWLDWITMILKNKSGHSIQINTIDTHQDDYAEITPIKATPVLGASSVNEDGTEEGKTEEEEEETIDTSDMEAVDRILSWDYPDRWRQKIPQVLSVSDLKHSKMEEVKKQTQDDSDASFQPSYVLPKTVEKGEGQTASYGALRGTAFHAVMAFADFEALSKEGGIESEIERLLNENKLTEQQAKMVDKKWVEGFIGSSIYQRILAAYRKNAPVVKEKPFIMSLSVDELANYDPVYRIEKKASSEDRVILQGIIDLFFEEDGEIVLVDYKTDKILDEATVAGYSVQLSLYEQALQRALQKKVKEKMLYAVRDRKEILC